MRDEGVLLLRIDRRPIFMLGDTGKPAFEEYTCLFFSLIFIDKDIFTSTIEHDAVIGSVEFERYASAVLEFVRFKDFYRFISSILLLRFP